MSRIMLVWIHQGQIRTQNERAMLREVAASTEVRDRSSRSGCVHRWQTKLTYVWPSSTTFDSSRGTTLPALPTTTGPPDMNASPFVAGVAVAMALAVRTEEVEWREEVLCEMRGKPTMAK